MHIEKNICDNIVGTLLDIDGKIKDTEKARLDLEDMDIRSELHLKVLEGAKPSKEGKVKCLKPPALYTLTQREIHDFLEFVESSQFPDSYAANISRCVNTKEGELTDLKSHDCHVLLQRLLHIGMRGYLNKDVFNPLTELASLFRQLCSRTLKLDVLDDLERKIPIILCKLEMIFPLAFFDITIHLVIHLAQEAKLGGPVHYRWMYPIERYLGSLKTMVINRARPEGSIAEAYIMKECLTFCSRYLHGTDTKFNREERNPDGEEHPDASFSVFKSKIRIFGAANYVQMTSQEYDALHWFILNNCVDIEPYLREYEEKVKQENSINWEVRHKKGFALWFRNRINKLRGSHPSEVTNELHALASGPDYNISKCNGCVVGGVKYLTKRRDGSLVTQNSGID